MSEVQKDQSLWKLFKGLLCVAASSFLFGMASIVSQWWLAASIFGWICVISLSAFASLLIWRGMDAMD